jgi:hypothetical protein
MCVELMAKVIVNGVVVSEKIVSCIEEGIEWGSMSEHEGYISVEINGEVEAFEKVGAFFTNKERALLLEAKQLGYTKEQVISMCKTDKLSIFQAVNNLKKLIRNEFAPLVTESINDIINRINAGGKFMVDKEKKIVFKRIGTAWFMQCKYWSKQDLIKFEAKECQH